MTVTIKGTEAVIDATIAKLKEGMAARVAAVNTEKADNIRVEPPGPDDYYVGGSDQIGRAPAIIVTELPSQDYEQEGPHSFTLAAEIAVVIVEEDGDRERLARKMLRQARAVTEVVWDDDPKQALDGSAFSVFPVRTIPGPIFDPEVYEVSAWRGLYTVVFRARQFEGD